MKRTKHRAARPREWQDRLLENALAAFRRITGLKAGLGAMKPKVRDDVRPDAAMDIEGLGKRVRFLVEIKAIDRAVALAAVKHRLKPLGRRGVLVAPYITPDLAARCRDIDLQFLDTVGNAYLRVPGLYIYIRGERPHGPVATYLQTRGTANATALRVIFALLCKPELLNAPYREIVGAAGVALGAVGWVLFDLQRRGYIIGGKRTRNRRLLEPGRLLDEWVTNYPIKLRPKLNQRRFRALEPDWWKNARLTDGALWGGEVGGTKLTGHLKPAACTIYIDPAVARERITKLVKDHRLRADPEGEVEVLDRFWNFPGDPQRPDLVPPLLIYADLMATLDPRNLEIAKLIREEQVELVLRRA